LMNPLPFLVVAHTDARKERRCAGRLVD
jgi:hypothetical protein